MENTYRSLLVQIELLEQLFRWGFRDPSCSTKHIRILPAYRLGRCRIVVLGLLGVQVGSLALQRPVACLHLRGVGSLLRPLCASSRHHVIPSTGLSGVSL